MDITILHGNIVSAPELGKLEIVEHGYLVAKPMIIANLIGRTIGIILMVWGLTAMKDGHSKLTAIITVAAGLALVCIPASLTNALLTLCGIIMVAIALMNILSRIKERTRISGIDTPNIIDAAE